jgi:hypothetical protein
MALAQTPADQTVNAIKALDLGAASLVTTQKGIQDDAHMWAVAVNISNKNYADLKNDLDVQRLDAEKQNEYARGFNTMAASYTSRCTRQFNRETEMGAYNACMSELAQLQPMQAKTNDWKDSVDRFAKAVTDKAAKVSADATALNQAQTAINVRIRENEAAGNQYLARRKILVLQLQAEQHGNNQCAEALRSNAADETVKEACGMLLDGNTIHDTIVVQVPGVPYPVWQHWNDSDPRWHVNLVQR